MIIIRAPLSFQQGLSIRTKNVYSANGFSFEMDLTNIKTNLCVFGGWFPIGVVTEDGKSEVAVVDDVAHTGKKSLRVRPNYSVLKGTIYYSQYNGGEEIRQTITNVGVSGARTLALHLDQDILSCDVSVWVKKATHQEITLKAVWHTRRDRVPFIKIAEQTVNEPVEKEHGWCKYCLQTKRCDTTRQVQIAIETRDEEPFYIDDVEVYFNRSPHVDVLIDQLGYETESNAKGIILQSSTPLRRPPSLFSLIDLETSTRVFTGKWTELGYCREWDLYHGEGDFSAFETPGRYIVETVVEGATHKSPPFEIRRV